MALSLVVWAGLLARSEPAHASPSFPRVMNDGLSLGCEPTCALCHKGETGFGTTNTPFGTKMRREANLRCCNGDALGDALALFQERRIDSDQDGTPDVDELVAGTDPNGDGALACERPILSDGSRVLGEGCSVGATPESGARTTERPQTDATASVLTTMLVGLLVRRRTRRRRQAS